MIRRLSVILMSVVAAGQDLPAPKQPVPRVPAPNLPMPRMPRIPLPGRRGPPAKKPAEAPPVLQYTGTLESLTNDGLVLKRLDGKTVHFVCTPDTEFYMTSGPVDAGDLQAGEEIEVEARKADGKLIALRVTRRTARAGTPEDDPDRPVMRRGKPAERAEAAAPEADPLWERAMEQAAEYGQFLPNFTCREEVRRYFAQSRKASAFRQLDTLTVDVAYVGGKEYYSNHRKGGRRSSAIEAEATGSWSFGEYGSTVQEVARNAAKYKYVKDSTASGLEARLYQVDMAQKDSGWRVEYKGRVVFPHYKGSVWVDVNSARVLRIELESVSMPADFEIERTEWAVDFAYIALADDYFLLPLAASNLACWRYNSDCSRNDIEFQNYRQFSAESSVYTTESTVEFEKGKKKTSKGK